MTSITSYADAMSFIHERSGYDRGFISNPFAGDDAAKLGLIRTERLLSVLGNPERAYPIVHIAGSKGKGSTTTFLDAMFRAMGLRSGRFLSPHLHRFNERFAVNGSAISDEAFAHMVALVEAATREVEARDPSIGDLTAWELSTAIALLWFARSNCDIVALEVGMGGTLDATNVVHPAVSVITRLDLEHQGILGSTIEEIASNKAGIIKPGAPAFTVAQPEKALAVIAAKAQDSAVPLHVSGVAWSVAGTSDDFSWAGGDTTWEHLRSSLVGDHQVENAGLALAVVADLSRRGVIPSVEDETAIRHGLAQAYLPGRFEQTRSGNGVPVVVDGAHTPESIRAVVHTLHQRMPGTRFFTVVGMLSDKDPNQILPSLDAVTVQWIVAPLQSPRSASVDGLADSLAHRGINALIVTSVAEGIALAQLLATDNDAILVVGSLTTAAEARQALGLAG